jgi:hypothetical protein
LDGLCLFPLTIIDECSVRRKTYSVNSSLRWSASESLTSDCEHNSQTPQISAVGEKRHFHLIRGSLRLRCSLVAIPASSSVSPEYHSHDTVHFGFTGFISNSTN